MKLQYKLLFIVGVVYLLTLGVIHRGAPILQGVVETGMVRVANSNVLVANSDDIDAYKLNWRPKEKMFFKKIRNNLKQPDDHYTESSVGTFRCDGTNTGPFGKTAFERVAEGIHILSAFFDDRTPTKFVRMLGTVKSVKGKVDRNVFFNKVCMFKLDSIQNSTAFITVEMTFYEMCENHKRSYGGWIFSCEVPAELRSIPTSLRVYGGLGNVTNLDNSKEICIKSFGKNVEKRKLNFGICVPPVYGKVKPKELIEFVELNRMLGADKFILYIEVSDDMISLDLQRVLRYYSSLNIVDLISWQLPVKPEMVWYHGQSVAINDCLYRYMYDFHHVSFIDLDEFLVPQKDLQTWNDVMAFLEKQDNGSFQQSSGFTFRSTYFSSDFSRRVFSSEMGTVVRTNRTRFFSYRRTKVIVRPSRVFEMGIHHVSRSWPDDKNYTVQSVPTDVAFIHHYRACIREFGIPCNNRIPDFTVPNKYGQQIKDNYLKTLYDITY